MSYEIGTYQDPRLQPPEEPGWGPADYYEGCAHALACRMQWERAHCEWYMGQFASLNLLAAEALGCGEDCDCYEE